jgi:putative glycosyltransferase (TIGR04348 family)
MSFIKPSLCIVTPALADANNGNWQTARRWARLLSGHYAVRLARQWPDGPSSHDGTDMLLALHARRSATSVVAWATAHPQRPLIVALTGTDLYRDIAHDVQAQRSLELAQRLVVLQELGPKALPEAFSDKCRVVFQSASARQALRKTTAHLRAVTVGHLRTEKAPATLWAAARLLRPDEGIFIDHIGAALSPDMAEAARQTAHECPHYRWLGGLPHAAARARIQRAHVLVHPSAMEGGAHVVMEAVLSGTPVLASDIDGNVGMLGRDYGGYFPVGDAAALADGLRQLRRGLNGSAGQLTTLQAQCESRAALFAPEAERRSLLGLLAELR